MEEAVTKYLAEIHINVKLNWLRAVIMFAKSHGVANEVALCHAVFEQLLYSNLSDSYEPLTKVPVVAMKAVIVKQMIFQYCEYVEEGDGLSWFHGDEEDINQPQQLSPLALDENTIQGTKILLTERVLLRRGILLLNPSNCQVLNGDIEAVRLNNKLLFAERLGIKNNMKSQRSTISPYMIRVPRISNQLLHTSDTKAKNANDKLEVKAQINDSEKTAVVPPIQNNLTPTATVPPLYNDVPQGTLITELTYAPPVIQKKLLLPLQRDVKSKPQSDHTEDLPIFVTDPQLILYDGKKASSISHKKSTNSSRNKSIMEYFPVSRNQRMTEQTAEGKCSSSHSVHPVPTVPLSQQRLVVVVDKNDHVVGTEFCERARIQNEVLPIQHLATSSLDTTNVSSHCNSSSNHNFTTKDGVGMNKEVLEEEEPVVITTQELINSSVPESSSFQNNSDLMSFIESSLPCRSNVEKSRPLVNPQWMDDVTSTAVIPYKRGRINNVSHQMSYRGSPYETSVMDRFHELRLVYVSQAFSHRKFWMLPKVVRVMKEALEFFNASILLPSVNCMP
ncbi:hypothetical protein DICVIV_02240 [Dictyocaulus viviparus]|uniref:RecQ-mediated genome instability protein 1 n=1 Tax=Dictyocaulus viviparus TaxID=29172 RepID=A0A0D8Y5X9_DICVI|nr:hypothetical protein DICVIV_02240 [Dictyocaulus viviparus]